MARHDDSAEHESGVSLIGGKALVLHDLPEGRVTLLLEGPEGDSDQSNASVLKVSEQLRAFNDYVERTQLH